jgi:cell division protein FtsQ
MPAKTIELSPDIRVMQRMTQMLWLCLLVLLAATLLLLLGRSPWFTLRSVVVEGDSAHYNAITLRANVAPRLHGNFFSLDLQATKSVFESQPWIRRAVVRREFPNRLRVFLEEHQAVGVWGRGMGGEAQLINSFGEVFDANTGEVDADEMPLFSGPSEQSRLMLDMYRRLNTQFQPYELVVDRLSLSGQGSWQATLDSGTVMELGRGGIEQVLSRTHVFLATANQASAQWGRKMQRDIESVDLRHSNGYAIKLRGVGTVPVKAVTPKE